MWFRPPDFLIFTGVMVYLVRLFQDTTLALRATEVSTGRQGINTEEEGSWRRVLLVTGKGDGQSDRLRVSLRGYSWG